MIRACVKCGKDYDNVGSFCPECFKQLTPEEIEKTQKAVREVFNLLANGVKDDGLRTNEERQADPDHPMEG